MRGAEIWNSRLISLKVGPVAYNGDFSHEVLVVWVQIHANLPHARQETPQKSTKVVRRWSRYCKLFVSPDNALTITPKCAVWSFASEFACLDSSVMRRPNPLVGRQPWRRGRATPASCSFTFSTSWQQSCGPSGTRLRKVANWTLPGVQYSEKRVCVFF